MARFSVIWAIGVAATLAACGSNVEQSAATGGLGGAAIGAAVGGPVGAGVGLGVGAVAGTGVEKGQERGLIPSEPGEHAHDSAQINPNEVRQAQTALRDQGLYRGPIDGIAGPETKQAVSEFQHRQGLPQTTALDRRTMDAINGSLAALPPERGPRAPQ